MLKTIHQEVAEFLDARAKKIAADATEFYKDGEHAVYQARMMIAHEFNLLSEHLFGQVEKRGLAVPSAPAAEAEKPSDVA